LTGNLIYKGCSLKNARKGDRLINGSSKHLSYFQ